MPKGWRRCRPSGPTLTLPICLSQAQEGGWSVGWRWHPSQIFDAVLVGKWLEGLEWRRAKLVIRSVEGWVSANAVDNSELDWQSSEWRRDSRIELIFSEAQAVESLQKGLAGCRIRRISELLGSF